jgi:hypothetical protein
MNILRFIADFKYEGYILALQTILTILKLFAKDIVEFIGMAVEAGNAVLDAFKSAGESPEAIAMKKAELAINIEREVKETFSASPSYIRTAFIEMVRGLYVMILDARSEKQKANYEKMLREHPVHSGNIDAVKKGMPEELRKLLFPVD